MSRVTTKPVRMQIRLSGDESDQLERLARRWEVSKTEAVRQAVARVLGEDAPAKQIDVSEGPGEKSLRYQFGRIHTNLDAMMRCLPLDSIQLKNGDVKNLLTAVQEMEAAIWESFSDDYRRGKLADEIRDEVGRPLARLLIKCRSNEEVDPRRVWNTVVGGLKRAVRA